MRGAVSTFKRMTCSVEKKVDEGEALKRCGRLGTPLLSISPAKKYCVVGKKN
jgi:hypothetical protein